MTILQISPAEDPMGQDMSVDEIMRKWPATVPVMLKYQMLCVGCPVGVFHNVHDACRAHGVDETAFLAELRQAIRAAERPISAYDSPR
jgi:hybrid cluster-associated redox disulfide protein